MMLCYIFIIGAIIGSFLNVVIYRYPIMLAREWRNECEAYLNQPSSQKSAAFHLAMPCSHCPACKKPIPGWLNIPILAYLFLRGKCRYCHTPISPRYIIVEIISAVLPVLIFLHSGFSLQFALLCLLTWGLIVLSFIDYEHQFLPDTITYCLLWLGLLASTHALFIPASSALMGAAAGYVLFFCLAKGYVLLRKKEGMGLGDCKMLAMIGAWVGIFSLLNVLLIASFLALIISALLLILKKIDVAKPIPFGPYLAIAGWCTALYGAHITRWVLLCL